MLWGSNIRIDTKGREVMRILPRNHDGVNEEWISDKTRFVWDGLRRQRLDVPYVRENGRLRKSNWHEALTMAAAAMKGKKVAGLVGDLASVEAAYSLKALIESLGGKVEIPHRWRAVCRWATARPMSARRRLRILIAPRRSC